MRSWFRALARNDAPISGGIPGEVQAQLLMAASKTMLGAFSRSCGRTRWPPDGFEKTKKVPGRTLSSRQAAANVTTRRRQIAQNAPARLNSGRTMTEQNILVHASGGDLPQVMKSMSVTIITCSNHQRFVCLT
jgi:hypothetical protein